MNTVLPLRAPRVSGAPRWFTKRAVATFAGIAVNVATPTELGGCAGELAYAEVDARLASESIVAVATHGFIELSFMTVDPSLLHQVVDSTTECSRNRWYVASQSKLEQG
jgi:hypothetical protein